MPPPLRELAAIARLSYDELSQSSGVPLRVALYGLLRREQSLVAAGEPPRPEVSRILDFAQSAHGDVVGMMVGRDDRLLDSASDGEWTLRDVLRHTIAVELRYAAQVEYSAGRAESDPVEIRPDLLPCDRLSPPEPTFARSRSGGVLDLLELLGTARGLSDLQLAKVPDSALTRPSQWGSVRVDVRTRVHQIAAHLTETAIQIEKIVGPGGEAQAIIRRCCITRGMHERWSPATDRALLDDAYRALPKN